MELGSHLAGSTKGEAMQLLAIDLEKHKNSIQIYAHTNGLFWMHVNLCEIEEKAMIEKCKKSFDLWNKL